MAEGPLLVVSSYSRFDNLAHGPRGSEAEHSLRVFRLDASTGTLSLQTAVGRDVMNPAFSRKHPEKNIVYACTETVEDNGEVVAYNVCNETGRMSQLGGPVDAGGSSTCYLTIDPTQRWMLVCNYWNSLLCSLPIDPSTGLLGPPAHSYDPKEGRAMKVSAANRANHSHNDASTAANRQADPHSHALVVCPYVPAKATLNEPTNSRYMAYVPDLGMDVIRQFSFDSVSGRLTPVGTFPSGAKGEAPHGPRYIAFQLRKKYAPAAFVVNELSCTIGVFAFDVDGAVAAHQYAERGGGSGSAGGRSHRPTLRLIQTISTLPPAFSREINTCGRICLHPSGEFVLVSNRGHDSIAVFRVQKRDMRLLPLGIFHTLGRTPRHFQLDSSGQWLIAANQDSDSLTVFRFNMSTGHLDAIPTSFVAVPSPNFVMFMDDQDVGSGLCWEIDRAAARL
jgi:6-phosphogluconolactonase (cycloisomerase 2 family)